MGNPSLLAELEAFDQKLRNLFSSRLDYYRVTLLYLLVKRLKITDVHMGGGSAEVRKFYYVVGFPTIVSVSTQVRTSDLLSMTLNQRGTRVYYKVFYHCLHRYWHERPALTFLKTELQGNQWPLFSGFSRSASSSVPCFPTRRSSARSEIFGASMSDHQKMIYGNKSVTRSLLHIAL